MRILVRGRDTLRDLPEGCGPLAVVSISDDPGNHPEMPDGCVAALRLHFHDVEVHFAADMFEPPKSVINAFSEEQASAVAVFLDNLPSDVATFVFQCEVGISRSAGMAAAVARFLGQDDMEFFRDHLPNRRVYRMVLEALVR